MKHIGSRYRRASAHRAMRLSEIGCLYFGPGELQLFMVAFFETCYRALRATCRISVKIRVVSKPGKGFLRKNTRFSLHSERRKHFVIVPQLAAGRIIQTPRL